MGENVVHTRLQNNYTYVFVESARLRLSCWTRSILLSWVPVVDLSENKYSPDIVRTFTTTNPVITLIYIQKFSCLLWIFCFFLFCKNTFVFLYWFVLPWFIAKIILLFVNISCLFIRQKKPLFIDIDLYSTGCLFYFLGIRKSVALIWKWELSNT